MPRELVESLHAFLDWSRAHARREIEIGTSLDGYSEPHRNVPSIGDRAAQPNHAYWPRFLLARESDLFELALH